MKNVVLEPSCSIVDDGYVSIVLALGDYELMHSEKIYSPPPSNPVTLRFLI